MVERASPQALGPRCVVAVGVALESGLEGAVQVEREPALAPRVRASIGWRPLTTLRFACGYDAVTSAFSTAIGLHAGPWNLVFAVATHPELGSSRAWWMEWQR
jgi:hypothetical protein